MKKLSNKGFTLVELIIVIAILAIIMLIAIPNFSGIQQRMQVRADKSSAAQIGKAVRIWYTEYTSDKAFETAVGAKNPVANFTGSKLNAIDAATDKSVVGNLPKQGVDADPDTEGEQAPKPAPISLIAKLNEYVDTDLTPKSLRGVSADGKTRTTLVEENQYYSVCLVGTGTAEKVVVCITKGGADALPDIPESGDIVVGYTGDGIITDPAPEALDKFNQTVAYKEP